MATAWAASSAASGAKARADLLVEHAAQLVTMAGGRAGEATGPRFGPELGAIKPIADGAVAADRGRIVAVGPTPEVRASVELTPEATIIDAGNQVVTPGLVDPHTHLLFAGSRLDEFIERLGGATYRQILARGGGIMSTVRATRAASDEELLALARRRLGWMLAAGTTTIEIKSGYGLSTDEELRLLRLIARLKETFPGTIVATFLGAHAVPPAPALPDGRQGAGDSDAYVETVVREMLPRVAAEGLAEFCDVFCEEGLFSVDQSRYILVEAAKLGLRAKVHADELAATGGAELAAAVGAVSADHLLHPSDAGIAAMAQAKVVAVLLPGTPFTLLSTEQAPARRMIDAGVPVALATDFNPGTSPTVTMTAAMALATRLLRLSPAETLAAATINAAAALGRAATLGSLEPGKQADMVLFATEHFGNIPYYVGVNLVDKVIARGRVVVAGGHVL